MLLNTVILLSPPGCLFISNTFEEGLNREGGGGGGLFNLAKTVVSVLHKALKYKLSGKAQVH